MNRQTVPLAAVFWLAALTLFWGAGWPAMKYAVGELPVYTFRFITALVGGLIVLAVSAVQGNAVTLARGEWKITALAGLFNVTGWFYFTALGLTLLPAGRAAVLAYTMPLFAVIAARVIQREPITRQRLLGLAFGLAAILMLLGDNAGRLGDAPLGVAAILCAAASWGVGTVLQKRHWNTPVLTLAGWQLLLGGIPMGLLAALHDRAPLDRLTMHGVLAVTYVILVATCLGYWAWFTVLTVTSASVASIAVLTVPLVGVLSSAAILGETLGWQEFAGLLLITAALATVLPLPRFFRR